MAWQIALIFNIIFGTIKSGLYKKLVDRLDPFVLMFHTNVWGIILFSTYYIFRYHQLPPIYPQMMILGVIFTLSYGAYLFATKISLSDSSVFGSYYIVVTLLLTAFLLGEWVLFIPTNINGIKNIFGIILAFLSIYLVTAVKKKDEKKMEKKWLLFIGMNILLNGFGVYQAKAFLIIHNPVESLLSQYLTGAPLQLMIGKIRNKGFVVSKNIYFWIVITSIVEFFALTLFYEAVKKGPAVIVLPVGMLSITILSSFIGITIFKESKVFTKVKLIGLIMGIVGVGMLVI